MRFGAKSCSTQENLGSARDIVQTHFGIGGMVRCFHVWISFGYILAISIDSCLVHFGAVVMGNVHIMDSPVEGWDTSQKAANCEAS
jgi:hypothetical protein